MYDSVSAGKPSSIVPDGSSYNTDDYGSFLGLKVGTGAKNAQLGLPRWLMLPGAGENQLGLGKEVL